MVDETWEQAMLREDFAAAWAIADHVLAARDPRTRDNPACPYHERWVWDGRPLSAQHVVVRCYHGLGDTLQFARFLPALGKLAASVTLEVQPELRALLANVPGVDRAVPFDPMAPIPAATDIEIMELQHALRRPPGDGQILAVSPVDTAASVGVCWQAGGWDPERSISLDQIRPLLPPGAVSLQRGASGLPDPLEGSMDMAATARVVAGLPCVITVDTMIAHLGGALGRPVHLLLKAEADWRWGRGRHTAWYPQTRIHRQAQPGDWSAALNSLQDACLLPLPSFTEEGRGEG